MSKTLTYPDGAAFPGRVAATADKSTAAWPMAPRAPDGARNVVVAVLDDVGYAQLGCFGSDIETPAFDALAERGLRYRNFHTTGMCSPTRACLMTGRNHHTAGMGGITDMAMGFPGYHGRIPKSCGFVPDVLRRAGWATFAAGKWHLAPSDELHAAAPRDRWPLGQGFERYYGFIGAETNQWAPQLTIDNRPQAFTPPAGYHLTADLVDHAIEMISDLRAADPDKPFFLYLAFGACHAPHHAPREWIERYRGRFDEGWDVWRERTHARQLALGILPQGTALTERPAWVQPWAGLPADERRLYARMMEVYAGFLSHTDHHLGRLLSFLDATGETERSAILALSDNGASAEGGPHGSVNEGLLFNGIPDDLADNLEYIDRLGGPETYPHYPWGWAMAGNTPFRRWKRETHEGGIADPLIVAVPGIGDPGAVRPHFLHAIDVAATVLDLSGVAMPEVLDGVVQEPVAGRSFVPTFADAATPAVRETQYFEQFGSRAIVHGGWKAVAWHCMGIKYQPGDDPRRPFAEDPWELYRVEEDFSESRDLAAVEPERLRALQDLWWAEAGRHGVLPLSAIRLFALDRPSALRARQRYVVRPHAAPVPEEVAPATKLRPHAIVATVDLPASGAEGVLLAHGGRFGGYSLYVQQGRLHYTYNFAGLEETTIQAPDPIASGPRTLGVAVTPGEGSAAHATLSIDGVEVATGTVRRTMPFRFALVGAGLTCGYDDGTAVSSNYAAPFRFTGLLHAAVVDLGGTPIVDLVAEVERAFRTQ